MAAQTLGWSGTNDLVTGYASQVVGSEQARRVNMVALCRVLVVQI